MSRGEQLYRMMMAASEAHDRCYYETSITILKDQKRPLILVLIMILATLTCMAFATDLPVTVGGHHADQTAFYNSAIFVGSIFVSLCAGLVTGCIGAGGGFIITPALMSLNVKGILTVGTEIFHILGKAIMGTLIYKKLGNISVSRAVAFLLGSGGGVVAVGIVNRLFALPEELKQVEVPFFVGLSETTVRTVNFAGMVIFLLVMGLFAIGVISKFLGSIESLGGMSREIVCATARSLCCKQLVPHLYQADVATKGVRLI